MADSLDMSGRGVLVTGGTRGIGRSIAERFLAVGASVVACGRTEPDRPIESEGRQAVFVPADVRDPESVDAMFDAALARIDRLDLLVNNAGGAPPAETGTASPRFSRAIIELNLIAPLVCSQRANACMQRQEHGGAIVNIASVSAIRPSPGAAAYGAAKAGLLNLTATMAVEFAPKVRVNAVVAGLIETEQSSLYYGDEAGVAAVAETVPLGRMGTGEDVANVCLFLASPLASYVSGASIVVHGGGERPAFLDAATPATPASPA
ncbi:MAG TPA: SDR family oxidoreductase [Acidimicrobiia bacterium]|jgi:NAD(P)-dependent dehydrogenase (short-subunit alcohol dehydrogenase family)